MERKSFVFNDMMNDTIIDEIEEEENDSRLATTTWRDEAFLRFRTINTEELALEYFCNRANPFYSKKSVNETIKMQQTGGFLDKSVENMEGIHYVVDSKRSKPPLLYVIRKEKVEKKDRKQLNLYYIAGGNIYQAPSFYDVIQARSYNCLDLLNQTFKEIQPNVEYTTIDQTILLNPSKKRIDEQDEPTLVYSIPPYAPEMQNHVDKLITSLDIQTNTLIEEKLRQQAIESGNVTNQTPQPFTQQQQ
ncbi:hypothetical protein ABK040_007805 [Willaertia magna]